MSIQNAWNEALRAAQAGISLYAFSPEVQERVKVRKESEQAARYGQAQEEVYEKAREERSNLFPQRRELERQLKAGEIGPEDIAAQMEDLRGQEKGLEEVQRRSLNEQSAAALRQYELTGDKEALEKYIKLESEDIPTAQFGRESQAAIERGRQARYQRRAEEMATAAEARLQDEYERLLNSNERLEQQIAYLKSEQKMKYTRHKGRTMGGDR